MIVFRGQYYTIQDSSAIHLHYGEYASLKYSEQEEDPHIAYYLRNTQSSSDGLQYAYPVDSGGNCGAGDDSGKWHCETVDSGSGVGQYTSLDLVNSGSYVTPYIAYYDETAGDLVLAHYTGWEFGGYCTNVNWYCETVDGTDGSNVGRFVSFRLGSASFAYYDATHGKLKYAYDVTSGGNCGGGSFQCDDIEDIGTKTQVGISLAVDGDDNPIIAYMDGSVATGSSDLKVAQPAYALGLLYGNCGPENPFSTWQCTTIDDSGYGAATAQYVAVAFNPDGLATIAYSQYRFTISPPSEDYDLKIAYQRLAVFLPLVVRND